MAETSLLMVCLIRCAWSVIALTWIIMIKIRSQKEKKHCKSSQLCLPPYWTRWNVHACHDCCLLLQFPFFHSVCASVSGCVCFMSILERLAHPLVHHWCLLTQAGTSGTQLLSLCFWPIKHGIKNRQTCKLLSSFFHFSHKCWVQPSRLAWPDSNA